MRISKKKSVHVLSAIALAWAFNASAIPITSSGTWTSLAEDNGAVANISGIGTNDVMWGNPFGTSTAGPSGYTFDGFDPPAPGDAPLDATLFPIGNFTHSNFTIGLPSISGAELDVMLDFTDEGVQQDFGISFVHTETPNRANPCAEGGAIPCPDLVSIPNAASSSTVTLMGTIYQLEILGFSQDGGTTIVPEFLSLEGLENVATLYARLVQVQQPGPGPSVPEPSTVGLMGVAFIGLWAFASRRRKRVH